MTVVIEEQVVEGRRLGRHVDHDPRSLLYRAVTSGAAAPTVSKVWVRRSVFDQGNTGSCTGQALTGVCATTPNRIRYKHYTEGLAVKVYETATGIDDIPGQFPPDDTGSTGLAAAKAAISLGLATSYTWAFGVDELAAGIVAHGPFAVGTNWYETMDQPDASGVIRIGGQIRGGHEYEIVGWHADTRIFEAVNSWGRGWGRNGRFLLPYDVMGRLLDEQGDAVTITR